MKKEDLVGLLLILSTLLYFGAHVVWALARPLLSVVVNATPR